MHKIASIAQRLLNMPSCKKLVRYKPTSVIAVVHDTSRCSECARCVSNISSLLYNAVAPGTPYPMGMTNEEMDYDDGALELLTTSLLHHILKPNTVFGDPSLVSICSSGIENVSLKATSMCPKHDFLGQRTAIKGIYGRLFIQDHFASPLAAYKILHIGQVKADEKVVDGEAGSLQHECSEYARIFEQDSNKATETVCGGVLVNCRYDRRLDESDIYTMGTSKSLLGPTKAIVMPVLDVPMNLLCGKLCDYVKSDPYNYSARTHAAYAIRFAFFRSAKAKLDDLHFLGSVHYDVKTDNFMTNRPFRDQKYTSPLVQVKHMVDVLVDAHTNLDCKKYEDVIDEVYTHFDDTLRLIDLGLTTKIGDKVVSFDCDEIGNKYPGISSRYMDTITASMVKEGSKRAKRSQSGDCLDVRKAQVDQLRHAHPYMDFVGVVCMGLELCRNGKLLNMWDRLSDSYLRHGFDWQDSWLAEVNAIAALIKKDTTEKSKYKDILLCDTVNLATSIVDAYNSRINKSTTDTCDSNEYKKARPSVEV